MDVVDNLYGKIYVQDRPKKNQLRSGPSVRSGLVWSGLVRPGPAWSGLVLGPRLRTDKSVYNPSLMRLMHACTRQTSGSLTNPARSVHLRLHSFDS
jgi:hypothetical protein